MRYLFLVHSRSALLLQFRRGEEYRELSTEIEMLCGRSTWQGENECLHRSPVYKEVDYKPQRHPQKCFYTCVLYAAINYISIRFSLSSFVHKKGCIICCSCGSSLHIENNAIALRVCFCVYVCSGLNKHSLKESSCLAISRVESSQVESAE